MITRSSLLSLAFSLSLFAAFSGDAQQSELSDADEILEKALEKIEHYAEEDDDTRYRYKLVSVREKLDSDGKVKEREEKLYECFPIDSFTYYRLLEKNGLPLTEKESKKELEREQKFREKTEKGKDPMEGERENSIAFNRELMSRYDVLLEGIEEVDGRRAYVLFFKPKSGDLPVRRQIDKAFNQSEGKIWIDTQEFELARAEFQMKKPVRIWWGILGSVSRVDGNFERTQLDDGTWFPKAFEFYTKMRIFIKSSHTHQEDRWLEPEKISEE
jgi:hypothetical protein